MDKEKLKELKATLDNMREGLIELAEGAERAATVWREFVDQIEVTRTLFLTDEWEDLFGDE
jgi:hypothetical protein